MKALEYDVETAANILKKKGYHLQKALLNSGDVTAKIGGFVAVAYTTGRILPQGRHPETLLEVLEVGNVS